MTTLANSSLNHNYLCSLSLDNFIANPEDKKDMYDLYAVINHTGGLYYGHCECTKHFNMYITTHTQIMLL